MKVLKCILWEGEGLYACNCSCLVTDCIIWSYYKVCTPDHAYRRSLVFPKRMRIADLVKFDEVVIAHCCDFPINMAGEEAVTFLSHS